MTRMQGGVRPPAGIRDVARKAGVSVATVSFALNGQPGVSDDTRHRILAAAAELGYRANPQAQALRRGRTTTYGLVIRNFSDIGINITGNSNQVQNCFIGTQADTDDLRRLIRLRAARRILILIGHR